MRSHASAALIVAAALSASPEAMGSDEWTTFELQSYNREYVNLRSGSEWEQGGVLKMKVRSPAHRLVIRDHELAMKPDGEQRFRSRIRVTFSGEGELVADIGLVGADKRLEDHVVVPLQEVEVFALVRFLKVDGGYEIETVELPVSVEVAIESQLGSKLVKVCRSAFSILGVKCSGLDAAFSTASVPLPKDGGRYFIAEEQLSRAERKKLNRFLARNQ